MYMNFTSSRAHSTWKPPSVEHLEGQVGGRSLGTTQVAAGSMVAPRSIAERLSSPDGIASTGPRWKTEKVSIIRSAFSSWILEMRSVPKPELVPPSREWHTWKP